MVAKTETNHINKDLVGWEVWETEEAKYAEQLVQKEVLNEKIYGTPLVLHSNNNGSPMKVATFQSFLEKNGIQSSYSRPRGSNDHPFSEAMFHTLKYRSVFPRKGFKTVEEARTWASKFFR